jgi:glutamine amidotransferase
MKIGIIDYGAGNLRSISNGFLRVGAKTGVVSTSAQIRASDALVLPGVGNFGDAMLKLKGVSDPIEEKIEEGAPFLGLCLGIQVLFDSSEEAPGVKGFGILKGTCKRFPGTVGKIPHMGWNSIKIERESPLLEGISDGDYFYFVHSYYAKPKENVVAASCDYGLSFPAVAVRDSVFACQFHPERSGEKGLRILGNFVKEGRK